MAIETPDLEKTFKKFAAVDLGTQKTTLQWVYGIDSPGMQHKTGFTFDLLKNLLEEIGFEKISRKEPRTHRYEPGMRIVCRKPEDYLEKQLFACFRKRLKNKLETDDSHILIPLESWLEKIFDSYRKSKQNKVACVNEVISKTAICNPHIPLTFLEECTKFGLVKKSEVKDKISLLNFLAKIEFHKKIFSLWIKSRKDIGGVGDEFKDFVDRLESLFSDILGRQMGYRERLEYITNLDPVDVKIFDFYLVSLEARKVFNMAVKQFHEGRFSNALDLFLRSSKLIPTAPCLLEPGRTWPYPWA